MIWVFLSQIKRNYRVKLFFSVVCCRSHNIRHTILLIVKECKKNCFEWFNLIHLCYNYYQSFCHFRLFFVGFTFVFNVSFCVVHNYVIVQMLLLLCVDKCLTISNVDRLLDTYHAFNACIGVTTSFRFVLGLHFNRLFVCTVLLRTISVDHSRFVAKIL